MKKRFMWIASKSFAFLLVLMCFLGTLVSCQKPIESKAQKDAITKTDEGTKTDDGAKPAEGTKQDDKPTPTLDAASEVLLEKLHGSWQSQYKEDFQFNKNTKMFLSRGEDWSDPKADPKSIVDNFGGTIEKIIADSETSGIIFIKYTLAPYGTVGNYYAIQYFDLVPQTSIKISGAYKKDGKTDTATLDEAIKEFTAENGYFAANSECEYHNLP